MVYTLSNLTLSVKDDISVTKSSSTVCGLRLRQAHERLGGALAIEMCQQLLLENESVDVVIMMRSGLCFGLGVANSLEQLGHPTRIYFDTIPNNSDISSIQRKVIIIDSVINSGNSILKLIGSISSRKVIILANVINSTSVSKFINFPTFVTRISDNSFIGSSQKLVHNGQGPDTGDRLFQSDFFIR